MIDINDLFSTRIRIEAFDVIKPFNMYNHWLDEFGVNLPWAASYFN